jgi:hypothetical protein
VDRVESRRFLTPRLRVSNPSRGSQLTRRPLVRPLALQQHVATIVAASGRLITFDFTSPALQAAWTET